MLINIIEKIHKKIFTFLYFLKRFGYANLLLVLCFIILSTIVFFLPIQNLDELWNYNFARCIANGLVPYNDFSMLQTPLSAYISALFVFVFDGSLFSFRIATFFLFAITQLLFYYLSFSITKNRTISFVLSAFVYALNTTSMFYNYNNLSLCIIILILLIIFKSEKACGYVTALLFSLLPLIKQSTGIVLLLLFLLLSFIEIIICKDSLIKFLKCVCLSLLPSLIFIIYIIASKNFDNFYEYTIEGTLQFTHKKTLIDFVCNNLISFLLVLILFGFLVFILFKIIKSKIFINKKSYCFIISFIWFLSVTYPIFDLMHFAVGIIPLIAVFFMFVEQIKLNKKEIILINFIALFILIMSFTFSIPLTNDYKSSNLNNFNGIPINKHLEENIELIDSYITDLQKKGHTVLIADATASIYTIPLNSYTKNWDMLLVGNVGNKTAYDLIKATDDAIFLVLKEESNLNWQSHFEIIDYIKVNYQKIDEVLYFDVYK